MPLAKTDKARGALDRRDPALSTLERRILIVSDGRRRSEELAAMLGDGVASAIQRLLLEGYLISAGVEAGPAAHRPVPGDMPSATPTSTTARRSMVAARMYMLDMLQLLRHQEAGTHAAEIRAANGSDAVLASLLAALQHIRASTSPSYAERVTQRLAEALPVECLSQLAAIAPELALPASRAG